MTETTEAQRAQRLARARAFLEAGRTGIDPAPAAPPAVQAAADGGADAPPEDGKPSRPDPTRFGDWEKNGRCIDF